MAEVDPIDERCGHVSCDDAAAMLSRFVHSHFHDGGERARFSIPADPKRDDDLRMHAFIARVRRLEAALRELCDRVDDASDPHQGTLPVVVLRGGYELDIGYTDELRKRGGIE